MTNCGIAGKFSTVQEILDPELPPFPMFRLPFRSVPRFHKEAPDFFTIRCSYNNKPLRFAAPTNSLLQRIFVDTESTLSGKSF
jgi:hypothetical protein